MSTSDPHASKAGSSPWVYPQPLVCVRDVEASSRWYQVLLGCRGAHGGRHYEQLTSGGRLVLQLHAWDAEHHHGPIGNPGVPNGNGVLLWFETEDFDAALERIAKLRAEIVLPRHRNPPDGRGGPNHWEIWVRDPDGYVVVLASPYGTADGDWKPDGSGVGPSAGGGDEARAANGTAAWPG